MGLFSCENKVGQQKIWELVTSGDRIMVDYRTMRILLRCLIEGVVFARLILVLGSNYFRTLIQFLSGEI